jgi:hypothetical protein
MTERTYTPATTAQLARLSQLGVHDLELTLMVQRRYSEARALALIDELAKYPGGTGALRHWRLFGEYPRNKRFAELPETDQANIAAWLAVGAVAEHYAAADYDSADARTTQLIELARNGDADADGNPGILARLEAVALMLGPGAREAAPELPRRMERAAREWRALAERQRERRERAARMSSAFIAARAVRRA